MKRLKVGDKLITIRGIVIPVDWDEKGSVVALAISTPDEDEYFIDRDHHKGKELLHFIQEDVEVSGVVREEDKKILNIQKYILKKGVGSKENLLN